MIQRPSHGGAQLTLTLALLLMCLPGLAGAQGKLSPTDFMDDLLSHYGDNSTVFISQLRTLLSNLSVGQGDNSSGEWPSRGAVSRVSLLGLVEPVPSLLRSA